MLTFENAQQCKNPQYITFVCDKTPNTSMDQKKALAPQGVWRPTASTTLEVTTLFCSDMLRGAGSSTATSLPGSRAAVLPFGERGPRCDTALGHCQGQHGKAPA